MSMGKLNKVVLLQIADTELGLKLISLGEGIPVFSVVCVVEILQSNEQDVNRVSVHVLSRQPGVPNGKPASRITQKSPARDPSKRRTRCSRELSSLWYHQLAILQ